VDEKQMDTQMIEIIFKVNKIISVEWMFYISI